MSDPSARPLSNWVIFGETPLGGEARFIGPVCRRGSGGLAGLRGCSGSYARAAGMPGCEPSAVRPQGEHASRPGRAPAPPRLRVDPPQN